MTDRYIEVRNWDKFQHADATKRGNDPKWIKNFTRLLSDDTYLALTGHRRAVLHGLWLEYARSGRRLPLDTRSLAHRLELRVTMKDLEAIKTLGFIEFCPDNGVTASSLEKRRGEKKEPYTSNAADDVADAVVVWPDVPGWSRPSDVLAELLERRNG